MRIIAKGVTTWYDFAIQIFKMAEKHIPLKIKTIEAIPTEMYPTPAERPVNSVLDCTKILDCYGIDALPWEDGLKKMIQMIYKK